VGSKLTLAPPTPTLPHEGGREKLRNLPSLKLDDLRRGEGRGEGACVSWLPTPA